MTYRIDLLARHHRHLLDVIAAAHPLITERHRDADLQGLRHLRREMEEALMAYERFIREEICDRSLWSRVDDATADARALLASCIQLRSDYEQFVARWSATDAQNSWPRYRLSALCMIQQFRDHVIEAALMSKRWIGDEAA